MRIALLISGRITRYDVCLLQVLNNSKHHQIDLFLSINNEYSDCLYFQTMRENLSRWLKGCNIDKYVIPKDIYDLFNPNESIAIHGKQMNLQEIDGKFVPFNCLSMYYNDNRAFNMACQYADSHDFEYDYYMKFRSDIICAEIPLNLPEPQNNIHLHNVVPICNFSSGGIYRKPIISDAWAFGNRKTMNIYSDTYRYVINKINEYCGKYYVAYECSLTDNIYENSVPHSYHRYYYRLDKNRRLFDINIDSRTKLPGQLPSMNINDERATTYVHVNEQYEG